MNEVVLTKIRLLEYQSRQKFDCYKRETLILITTDSEFLAEKLISNGFNCK